MYIIALIMTILYGCLIFLSRREITDDGIKGIKKVFYRMAAYIYRKACEKNVPLFNKAEVLKDLERLHPGTAVKHIKRDYYIKKTGLVLMIFSAGTIISLIVCIRSALGGVLREDGSILRGSFNQEAQNIRLASSINDTDVFEIDVESRKLSKEEIDALYAEFTDMLTVRMLGENESLDNVSKNLDLADSYNDYPFDVDWKSSNMEIVGISGSISEVETAETVVLTADITYGENEWTEDFLINVVPEDISEKERERIQIQKMLEVSEEESRMEESWILPEEYNGVPLKWREIIDDNSRVIWICLMIVGAAVFFFQDRDLHSELEKKNKAMKREYPDIVQKFVLYMGAGMTIRSTFRKIADEYESNMSGEKDMHPAYEEILYTCRELQSGVSESAAYEHFGVRTGMQEYIRFCTLLQQNLKKGSSALLERLREEADRAVQEKLLNSRRLGEEASTRLLVPMVLMLLVVMVMIIVPAFSSTSL
jgi:hypothetical protein